MSKSFRIAALCAALSATASVAKAQNAGFVLFGDADEKAKQLSAEQKFVHPVTTPYYHEDSFVSTDVRAWFAYHDFPSGGVINGGSAKDYALQIRLALTDQLQLVAYKDGYLDLDAGLSNDGGWNDVAAGLKWNFLQDYDHDLYAAVGVGYEIPIGDRSVLQNDDEIRVWASVNKGFGKLHLGATVNGLFSLGEDADDTLGDSDRIIWNLHADYYVCKWFSPVVEINGFHTINPGTEVVPFNGLDIANLGGGETVITAGLGAEFRLFENLAARAAFELPITDGTDLYGYRITASLVYEF